MYEISTMFDVRKMKIEIVYLHIIGDNKNVFQFQLIPYKYINDSVLL